MLKKSDKTKVLIKSAFINLLGEKGLNEVTVKNIADSLDINRGTFYIHYEDKYALLEEIEMDIINNINQILEDGINFAGINSIMEGNKNVLLDTLTNVYSYIKEVSDIIGILLGPKGDIAFQWRVKILVESVLQKNLEYLNMENTMYYKYMSVIASSAQLGIVEKWIKSDFKETPEELALFMSNIIHEVFFKVLVSEKTKG
ncbi:MAG: TetR/AcrR family transcriptional regulator [Clostridium sp.]